MAYQYSKQIFKMSKFLLTILIKYVMYFICKYITFINIDNTKFIQHMVFHLNILLAWLLFIKVQETV